MNELLERYPNIKNRKGIRTQSYNICPIGVESQHDNQKYTITMDAAKSLKDQIESTPLMYAKTDDKLPKNHGDVKRTVIGAGLGGRIVKDETGINWLVGDYAVYTDIDPDIYERIQEFKDDVSASWELRETLLDKEGNIYDANYEGTSVMDKDYSAYRHHGLLVADKGNGEPTPMITYDDILKEVVGNDYRIKLDNLQKEVDEAKVKIDELDKRHIDEIKEKEEVIRETNNENQKLRELNNGFAELVK